MGVPPLALIPMIAIFPVVGPSVLACPARRDAFGIVFGANSTQASQSKLSAGPERSPDFFERLQLSIAHARVAVRP